MKDTPIPYDIVSRKIEESGIESISRASIREIKRLVDNIESETGMKYIRMEMGVPGLKANQIGVKAHCKALEDGVASSYPDIDGVSLLKNEISRFAKLFLDVDVDSANCIPTVGSLQGGFACFMTVTRLYKEKDTILFIDPCFPVHKQQCRVLGIKHEGFDVYNYRGEKLRTRLESYFEKGNISAVLYSNPNNPSWICFTDEELKIIGELANKYNVVILEDLAYFGMDFRKDYSRPGQSPFQPSVAKYTDNYVLLVSSSKVFSYAGERIGMMLISNKLFNTKAPDLRRYYAFDVFGKAMIFGTIYSLSAGTSHSAQYGLAAILKAVNDGTYNLLDDVREYGAKATIMKKLFIDNGFQIVYDKDIDDLIADGFYFTLSYPGMSADELLKEMIFYGISAISLVITGSEKAEGIRACVSQTQRNQFPVLEYRLNKFYEHHPINK